MSEQHERSNAGSDLGRTVPCDAQQSSVVSSIAAWVSPMQNTSPSGAVTVSVTCVTMASAARIVASGRRMSNGGDATTHGVARIADNAPGLPLPAVRTSPLAS